MSDPADLFAFVAPAHLRQGDYALFVVTQERQLVDGFDRYYRRTKEIASLWPSSCMPSTANDA